MLETEPESERTLVRKTAPAAAAAPSVVHALLLRRDGDAPQRIALGPQGVRLGRGAQNDVVLASPEVSRQHCSIGLAGGAAVLTDHDSTNGVHVDGLRVQGTVPLVPGSRIAIGPFSLRYQRGSAKDLADAEAREYEQARAVAYIQALLPPPLTEGAVRADWRFVPSAQLGGDAFGYRWMDDTKFVMFMLDVSGHGVGSALLAASAANMLRSGGMGGLNPADPVAILQAVNAAFQMDDHNGLFFTLWYGVYHRTARILRYASAGHHPAILACGSELFSLATRAPGIGMAPAARFKSQDVAIPPGSLMHLFSDGAFEVTYADGTEGTLQDFQQLLATAGPDPGPVFAAVRERTGRRPFEDDVSLLTLSFD